MTQDNASKPRAAGSRLGPHKVATLTRAHLDAFGDALKRAFEPAAIEVDEVAALAKGAVRYRIGAKAPILRSTSSADALWLLAKGRASMGFWDAQGGWHQTRATTAGAWLDLSSAWLRGNYIEAAVAATDVTAYELPIHAIEEVCTQHPRILRLLLASMAERVKHATEMTRDLANKDVLGRLAGWLLRATTSSSDGTHVVLAQQKRALASELGTSPETLSRSLARLRALGCVAMKGYRIDILDEDKLRETAHDFAPALHSHDST